MRAVFSLCGLLLVLFLVSKMAGSQLAVWSGSTARELPAHTTNAAPATQPANTAPAATATQQRAAQITQAMEQAAAQRADDAASR